MTTKHPDVLHAQILDQYGDCESATIALTSTEVMQWYREHDINLDAVSLNYDTFTAHRWR